jgi:hypothetical protein
MPTDVIIVTQEDLARRLDEAAGRSVVVEHSGVRYRIEPEDPFAFYDPARVRRRSRRALVPSEASWTRRS